MNEIAVLEDTRSVVRICKLYYEDQVSQKEISEKLQISRPQISRVLSYARDSGIVTIQLHNPYALENQFEKSLQEKFFLNDAIIAYKNQPVTGRKLAEGINRALNDSIRGIVTPHGIQSYFHCLTYLAGVTGQAVAFFSTASLPL